MAAMAAAMVVYGMLTAWWMITGQDPSGGWGLHFVSAGLQLVGWSLLAFIVAFLIGLLRSPK